MIKRLTISLFALLTFAVAGYGVLDFRARSSLSKAEILAERGVWVGVRRHLERYLWLHPTDGEVRLRLAEALSKDDDLPAKTSVPLAIEQLQQISLDSPVSARARTQEGRLQFLILHRPARAEKLFRQAIEQAPDMPDAYYLLWKLMDLTGRSHLSQDVFWKYYGLSPAESQKGLLAEWYMGQFYSVAANSSLDTFLGFLGEGEATSETVEPRRFIRFRQTEPDEALAHAALARWFHYEGDPHQALKLLDQVPESVEAPLNDAFYVATLLETLIELGEFERAGKVFQQWPGKQDGYEYWHAKAVILDEVEERFDEALSAYEQSLTFWPGPVDWRTRHRMAGLCLTRMGNKPRAAELRLDAERVEKLMQAEAHQSVNDALSQLDNPQALRDIVSFYKKLKCPREAAAWQVQLDRLVGK